MSLREFVKSEFRDRFNEWVNSLPAKSRMIFSQAIDSSEWYPLKHAGTLPTQKIAELFFKGDNRKAAKEAGSFSAQKALSGIYRIFVKASSPGYIVQRASRIFSTYYRPCNMEIVDKSEKSVTLEITEMQGSDEITELRIGGWIERALTISGAEDVSVDITSSITRGDISTVYCISWL